MRGISRNPFEGVIDESVTRAVDEARNISASKGSPTPGLPARIVTIQGGDSVTVISKHIALTNIDFSDDPQAVSI